MSDSDTYERAILLTLGREEVPLKASEVADWSGLHRSTAYRHLKRMEQEGKVRQNEVGYWELRAGDD